MPTQNQNDRNDQSTGAVNHGQDQKRDDQGQNQKRDDSSNFGKKTAGVDRDSDSERQGKQGQGRDPREDSF